MRREETRCHPDIIFHRKDNQIQSIIELHCSYDDFQYPLLFLYGGDGYHLNIPKAGKEAGENKSMSSMDFYASYFMIQPNTSSHIH